SRAGAVEAAGPASPGTIEPGRSERDVDAPGSAGRPCGSRRCPARRGDRGRQAPRDRAAPGRRRDRRPGADPGRVPWPLALRPFPACPDYGVPVGAPAIRQAYISIEVAVRSIAGSTVV